MAKRTGRHREYREQRQDGYVNVLNNYGTNRDNASSYNFESDGMIPDVVLTEHYEQNGLFAKIIDAPAEEAVKHGFEFDGEFPEAEEVLVDTLDALGWEEKAATAIKWARLYGGAIVVMLIDDGRGIDEPLDRKNIRGIDDIRVYERAIVNPNWAAALYGQPQYYSVSSMSGYFTVHASRCLVFKNGVLPEYTMNAQYRFWGLPEYLRIRNELRECSTSHGLGVKLLDRSVQAIYSMQGLANMLSTEDGEEKVLKRLRIIDMARGVLNSIAIDADGENYDFKTIPFSGVKDIIDTTCNMLSAVTSIPQAILFGRSPAGMNSTGRSDLENYYNLIERIQKIMLYGNLKTLTDVILRAAIAQGDIDGKPTAGIKFKPLWSLSETEQATVDQTKAATSTTKAQTAQLYVDMGVLDPSEVRKALADDNEFEIEKMLDDLPEDDLMAGWEAETIEEIPQASDTPEADKPQSLQLSKGDGKDTSADDKWVTLKNGAHVLLSDDGTVKAGMGGKFNDKTMFEVAQEKLPAHIRKAAETLSFSSASQLPQARQWLISGYLSKMQKYTNSAKSAKDPKAIETATKKAKQAHEVVEYLESMNGGNVRSKADGQDTSASVGVIVLNDTGEGVLCGRRSDNKLVCGPGGNIQEGETPAQAAIRETQEEFGITPLNLKRVGRITGFEGGKYGEPYIYLCTEYEGEPKGSKEIRNPCFFPMDEFEPESIDLFPPFAESLKFLEENTEKSFINLPEHGIIKSDGGQGSGRYPKGSGELDKLSAAGANSSIPAFTEKALNKHWGGSSNHSKEYPGFTKEQYAERALSLVRSATSESILGYRAADGAIARYDKTTNDFVKGRDTGVASMYKPRDGEEYFKRAMQREGGTQDD